MHPVAISKNLYSCILVNAHAFDGSIDAKTAAAFYLASYLACCTVHTVWMLEFAHIDSD